MSKLPNPILMARIGAPHGIKGEVRVKSFTEDPMDLGNYGSLSDSKGNRFTVLNLRSAKNMLVVRFKEVTDRDAAEVLRNVELFVDRSALPEVEEEDEFYLNDLIGMSVRSNDGDIIGKIRDVPNFGAGDMLEIVPVDGQGGAASYYLPFTLQVVPEIDIDRNEVTVVPPGEVIAREEDK